MTQLEIAAVKPIIIHRADVEAVIDYARKNCTPRDYLMVRLPSQIGLRSGEIATLRIEDIDFAARTFVVLDSKKYERYPLPLDALTLQLIKDLIGKRASGYVFRQLTWGRCKADLPFTNTHIWKIVRDIALKAGVKKFNPRTLRQYFAAKWALVDKKNIVVLQRILRHTNLATTHLYVSRLTFFEDIQKEYDSIQKSPFVEASVEVTEVSVEIQTIEEDVCHSCQSLPICKIGPRPYGCVIFKRIISASASNPLLKVDKPC